MPVYLRPNELFVKNPNGSGYLPQNVISETSTAEMLAAFDETIANTQESLDTITAEAQTAVDGIESQKNTMIASIASVAGQGTDTTLSQSGVAADAKTVGDLKSAFATDEANLIITDSHTDKNTSSIDATDAALGVSATEQTVRRTVNLNHYRGNTGKLAVANPYNINGVLQKVIVNASIGNTAGNTGKLYCRIIHPEYMVKCIGKRLNDIPYIAEQQANVTATASLEYRDAVNVTYDFTNDNIPYADVLYILLYVVDDDSSAHIYIRTMNYADDYLPFCAVGSGWINYSIVNGWTTFQSFTADKSYYLPISADVGVITKNVTVAIDNPWAGKIAAAYGTSLTANGGWTDVLKARLGFSKMYNRGSGGTTLTDLSGIGLSNYVTSITVYNDSTVWDEGRTTCYYDANNIPEGYENYTHTDIVTGWYSGTNRVNTLPTNADLVLIDLCTNDFYRISNNNLDYDTYVNTPIVKTAYQESISPCQYDVKKYGDAFANMVKTIQTRCPKARIVVWGMLYNDAIANQVGGEPSNALNIWEKLYSQTKLLCQMFGVYFIDMREETGMNVFNVKSYCEDGVHPYKPTYTTEKGKYAVANVLTKHLLNVYPKDYGVS